MNPLIWVYLNQRIVLFFSFIEGRLQCLCECLFVGHCFIGGVSIFGFPTLVNACLGTCAHLLCQLQKKMQDMYDQQVQQVDVTNGSIIRSLMQSKPHVLPALICTKKLWV